MERIKTRREDIFYNFPQVLSEYADELLPLNRCLEFLETHFPHFCQEYFSRGLQVYSGQVNAFQFDINQEV
jgi:hypothetical protein